MPSAGDWQAWGGPGRRNGSFLKPRAIGVDSGEVYVIDGTGRVQVFTEEGRYLRQWSVPDAENGTPTCVAFDRQGRVLVPDTHYHRILVYTRDGKPLDPTGGTPVPPHPDNTETAPSARKPPLLTTKSLNHSIPQSLNSSHAWGSYGTGPGQFVYPTGIAEGPNGELYVSEYGVDAERMQVFDQGGRFLRQWGGFGEGPGQFNRAMAVVMGPDGALYVADTGNNRVQRFDTDGTVLGVIGTAGTAPGRLSAPFDVSVAPDGSVCVCEYGNNRVSCFTASGKLLGVFGEPGRGPGQFHGPRGIAVSASGVVYVADTGNHRIQRAPLTPLSPNKPRLLTTKSLNLSSSQSLNRSITQSLNSSPGRA